MKKVQNRATSVEKKAISELKCDKCGWTIPKEDYEGSGDCYKCFEGMMGGGK